MCIRLDCIDLAVPHQARDEGDWKTTGVEESGEKQLDVIFPSNTLPSK